MVQSRTVLARHERRNRVPAAGRRPARGTHPAGLHMGFLDRLKALFGGKKGGAEQGLYEALERQVDAIEGRLIISDRAKRVEGGLGGFDLALDEARQVLAGYTGEGAAPEALEVLSKRLDLAAQAAHLLRETDPGRKKQMCERFVADFHEMRDDLHFRTKSKYERLRIDFQSGRLQ